MVTGLVNAENVSGMRHGQLESDVCVFNLATVFAERNHITV